jgi:hypothetical protein
VRFCEPAERCERFELTGPAFDLVGLDRDEALELFAGVLELSTREEAAREIGARWREPRVDFQGFSVVALRVFPPVLAVGEQA